MPVSVSRHANREVEGMLALSARAYMQDVPDCKPWWAWHNQFGLPRFMPLGVKPGQIILDEVGMSTVFIPSRVEDNKILCNNDP